MCRSSKEAERAFYDAFNQRDLVLMMSVWNETDDSTCIHPGGLRLRGIQTIRESWRAIFSAEQNIHVSIDSAICYETESLSIRQVIETITVAGELHGTVLATNVYHRTDGVWRISHHHASVEPPKPSTRSDLH